MPIVITASGELVAEIETVLAMSLVAVDILA
jgi:hypothetical protein